MASTPANIESDESSNASRRSHEPVGDTDTFCAQSSSARSSSQPEESKRGRAVKRASSHVTHDVGGSSQAKKARHRAPSWSEKMIQLNEYRLLFNSVLEDFVAGAPFETAEDFEPCQLNQTQWSSQDKIDLFTKINTAGTQNLAVLRQAVPSKSEPEIHEYLLTLQRAVDDLHSLVRSGKKEAKRLLSYYKIPASTEISPSCDVGLDERANDLREKVEEHDAVRERAAFGHYWLLDADVVADIEDAVGQQIEARIDGNPPVLENEQGFAKLLPAFQLLNVPKWLELSSRLFMNSSSQEPETNWTTLESNLADSPSCFASVLVDFHSLTMSFTKRLLSAALFQANSRIRARGWRPDLRSPPCVRKRDVLTALRVIGFKQNYRKYWVHMARRCGLCVVDKGLPSGEKRRARQEFISFDEVERRLSLKAGSAFRNRLHCLTAVVTTKLPSSEQSVEASLHNDFRLPTQGQSLPIIPESTKEDEMLTRHEEYAEAIDQIAGLQDERYLWVDVLGKSSTPADCNPQAIEKPLLAPRPIVKQPSELESWHENIDHLQEWEQLGYIDTTDEDREDLTPEPRYTSHSMTAGNGDLAGNGESAENIQAQGELSEAQELGMDGALEEDQMELPSPSSDVEMIEANKEAERALSSSEDLLTSESEISELSSTGDISEDDPASMDSPMRDTPSIPIQTATPQMATGACASARLEARHPSPSSSPYESPSLLPEGPARKQSSPSEDLGSEDGNRVLTSVESHARPLGSVERGRSIEPRQGQPRRSSRSSRAARPAYAFPRVDEDGQLVQQDDSSESEYESEIH